MKDLVITMPTSSVMLQILRKIEASAEQAATGKVPMDDTYTVKLSRFDIGTVGQCIKSLEELEREKTRNGKGLSENPNE